MGDNKFSNRKMSSLVVPIPVNPIIFSALKALYATGYKNSWTLDSFGRPHYHYSARDGQITYYYHLPWEAPIKGLPVFTRRFLRPRWGFIYTGRIREAIRRISVETADVFLILMSRIAQLPDPKFDIARIGLEEIAEYRNVRVRHGSSQKLYEDFKQEVLRLADIRLTMSWQDYKTGQEMSFGSERLDHLLDIVDIEYKKDGKNLTAFRIRCGQALAHFLDPDVLHWIGYYSRALLQLNPYLDLFTKKLGTYWIMLGIAVGKKGIFPLATPRTILDFCGDAINWRCTGQTVNAFINAHNRLQEIGVIEASPELEPVSRRRGYFSRWLDTPLTVRLTRTIWRVDLTAPQNRTDVNGPKGRRRSKNPLETPSTLQGLRDNPELIRHLREVFGLHQVELARAVGVTRQTLSRYERGISQLPDERADQILKIWQSKTKIGN